MFIMLNTLFIKFRVLLFNVIKPIIIKHLLAIKVSRFIIKHKVCLFMTLFIKSCIAKNMPKIINYTII